MALALALAGCATAPDPLPTPLPSPVPTESRLPPLTSRDHQRILAAFGGEYSAPALETLGNILRAGTRAGVQATYNPVGP